MGLLGLLLVAAAAAVGVELVLSNEASADLEVFDRTFEVSENGIFLLGAASALVLVLGLVLLSAGMGRMRSRRMRRRELDRQRRREVTAAESELAATRAEKERLEEELAEERRSRMTLGGTVPPEAVPTTQPGTAYDTQTYEPYPADQDAMARDQQDEQAPTNSGQPEVEHRDERGGLLGRLRH